MTDLRAPGAAGERLRPSRGGLGGGTGARAGAVPAVDRVGSGLRLTPRGGARVPHVLLGSFLVIVCGAVFYLVSVQSSGRVPVLALARDVSAGHVLVVGDVRVVQVAAGGDVATVSAAKVDTVIGAVMAAPRTAGALLAPADVGVAKFPPAGQAVAAVALRDGQFPPGLSTGSKVAALVAAPGQAGNGVGAQAPGRASWLPGVVVSIGSGSSNAAGTVVALLMSRTDAAALGAVSAQAGAGGGTSSVSLVLLPPGSDVGNG